MALSLVVLVAILQGVGIWLGTRDSQQATRPPAAYTDTPVPAGTYYYRLRAENSVSISAWSNVAGLIVVP